mgnify:CR=1 FL=1
MNGEEGADGIGNVMTWAQIEGDLRTALLVALEMNYDEPMRSLALCNDADIEGVISGLTVQGRPPNIAMKGRIRLFFNGIRSACGTLPGATTTSPQTPPVITVTPSSTELSATSAGAVALNGTVTQVGQVLTKMLPRIERDRLSAEYRRRTGGDPAPEADLTPEQCTAFNLLIKEDETIAVDFAVWVPYGNRLLKKRAIEGTRPGPNNTHIPIALYGPPDLHEWRRCYRMFRTGSLQQGAIDIEWLDRYNERFGDEAAKHPECWALLYQSEARTRGEHMNRVRRRLQAEKDEADKKGHEHPFDPQRPWNEVFRQLCVAEGAWWFEQFKEPCMYVHNKVESPTERVDGDEPVSGQAAGGGQFVEPPPRGPPRTRTKTSGGGGANNNSNNKAQGCGVYNKSGTELCKGFQHGTCHKLVSSRCALNYALAHQCSLCLDNRHGADECTKNQKGNDGGGKGAGKRGKKRKAGK